MSILDTLFSFEGRLRRQHFWFYVLAATVLSTGSFFALFDLRPDFSDATGGYSEIGSGSLWYGLLQVALIWSHLAVLTKRWHDRGKSGWWSLILIIPVVGFVWTFIECGLLDGSASENRFGASPKAVFRRV